MRGIGDWNGVLLYEADGEDLWTKDHLLAIEELEAGIFRLDDWPTVCKAQSPANRTCSDRALISPLTVLKEMNITDLKSTSQAELDRAWELFY